MDRLRRSAVLAELADRLQGNGSWCGETHIQKAAFLLQEALCVPLGFRFILYRRGPFSFDLRDELTAMRADGLLRVRPREQPYGPSLDATERSRALRQRLPKTIEGVQPQVSFVGERMGVRSASELERLSTAYYVMHQDLPQADLDERVRRVTRLKPHVGAEQARAALLEVDRMKTDAERKGLRFVI